MRVDEGELLQLVLFLELQRSAKISVIQVSHEHDNNTLTEQANVYL